MDKIKLHSVFGNLPHCNLERLINIIHEKEQKAFMYIYAN